MNRYCIAWWNLENLFDVEESPHRSDKLKNALKKELQEGIDELCVFSGNTSVDYKEVSPRLEWAHKKDFVQAASNHLAGAMKLFQDLPWVS